MTKDQLKTGMLVQCRNKNIYLLINDTLIGFVSFIDLDNFNYDLIDIFDGGHVEWDIMRVTGVLKKGGLLKKNWSYYINNKAIWDRNESVNKTKPGSKLRTEQFDIETDRWVERDRD